MIECRNCPLLTNLNKCGRNFSTKTIPINNQIVMVGAYPINCRIAIQNYTGIRGLDRAYIPNSTN